MLHSVNRFHVNCCHASSQISTLNSDDTKATTGRTEFQKAPPGYIEISFPDVPTLGVAEVISKRSSPSIVLRTLKVMFSGWI